MTTQSNKVTLCWPNRTDQAVLSGGSFLSTLPLVNAQNRIFGKKARTTDVNTASTQFLVDLDKGRAIGSVAIAAHNFSASATWNITLYGDNAKTIINYTSGFINIWPAFYTPEQLEWEDNNYWFGNAVLDSASTYTPLATLFLPDNITARAMKIEIVDTLNSSAYLEFGRLFIAEVFQPTINANYGIQFGHDNPTTFETSLGGTEYFDRQRLKRNAVFTLGALYQDEAFLRIYAMQRDQGIDKEILFAQEVNDSQAFYFRTFIGRLKQADVIAQPYIDRHTVNFDILEII